MLRGPPHRPPLFALLFASLSLHGCATQLSDEQRRKPEASSRSAAKPLPPPKLELPIEPPFGPLEVDNSGLPCDVEAVLKAKCRRCHTEPRRHSAPFPLLRWEDLQLVHRNEPLYVHVAKVVRSGFMPYRIPANPPVEPLSEAEKNVLTDWSEAGGPRGACGPDARTSDASAPDAGATKAASSTPKSGKKP
jgi:hypothetical protein